MKDENYLKNIVKALKKIRDAENLNYVLKIALEKILDITELDCGGIHLYENNHFILQYSKGLSKKFLDEIKVIPKNAPQANMALKGKPFIIDYENFADTPENDIRKKEGIKTIFYIPVNYNDKLIAGLNLASKKPIENIQKTKHTIDIITIQLGCDINKLKFQKNLIESEHSYRHIVKNINDGFVTLDGNGNILDINQKAKNILGIDNNEEVIGKNINCFIKNNFEFNNTY